jgi:phytoene synthase
LDALVRRVDEDRWLASRFADRAQRARLIALYALNYEIARIAETVRGPALGDIRFAWWQEALASPAAAGTQPVLSAFMAQRPGPADVVNFQEIIAARRGADLSPTPFADLDTLEDYAAKTAGGLIAIAARCFGGIDPALAHAAGRAWGMAGALRAAPFWAAQGRTLLPEGIEATAVLARLQLAYGQARRLSRTAPAAAFAAYGYVTLAPAYARSTERAPPALFMRQVRLVMASARGRV